MYENYVELMLKSENLAQNQNRSVTQSLVNLVIGNNNPNNMSFLHNGINNKNIYLQYTVIEAESK